MGSLVITDDQLDQPSFYRTLSANQTLPSSIELNFSQPNYGRSLFLLNEREVVERYGSKESRVPCLTLHGVSVQLKPSSIIRQYVIYLFQTDVLATYRTESRRVGLAISRQQGKASFHRVSAKDKSREVRRTRALAIRALYALGLDYGAVKAAVVPGNQIVILDVIPGPRLNREVEQQFAKAIKLYSKGLPRLAVPLRQVMLGADPEFMMQSLEGQIVLASKYFPRFGSVGCDAIWHGQNRSHKPLVELRPRPTNNPRQLIIRMYQGMMKATQKVGGSVQWLAGALPHKSYPLGGHVHFSGIPLNFKLLRALDNYLALPLVLVEDPRGVKRRPKYGFLGDFRRQFHGGFEYRTLPSWLVSPTLTKGVIAAAQLIAARYPYLSLNPLKEIAIQEAYYRGSKEKLKSFVYELWEDLAHLPEYNQNKTYLDAFYQLLLSGKTWDERSDFRRRWRLPPYQR